MTLKDLRKKKNLRAQDVAVALNVAVSTVNSWEQGRATPNFSLIRPLMQLFDVNFDELESAILSSQKNI